MTIDQHTGAQQAFRALRLLEKQCIPVLRHRPPFWRPRPPAIWHDVHVPAWTWTDPVPVDTGTPLVTLDVTAAWVGAIASTPFAHGALMPTGPVRVDARGGIAPGYYLTDVQPWSVPGIVSPLGNTERLEDEDRVWVAHPTLLQLLQLTEDGYWGGVTVYDSFTCGKSVRFARWSDALKAHRNALLDRLDACDEPTCVECMQLKEAYDDFKTSYAQAVSMMLTGDQCGVRRPDWAHAIQSAAAASTWRKAFRALLAGYAPVSMGDVDEITYIAEDFYEMLLADQPPFRIDPTKRQLGSLKVKRQWLAGSDDAQ